MDTKIKNTLEHFFSQYKQVTLPKGEIIVRIGDQVDNIFFIESGRVRKYLISPNGEEFILNIFLPYSFFPMSSVLSQGVSMYYYEAVTPVVMRKAPSKNVLNFLKGQPEVMFDLLERVYRGNNGLLKKLYYFMSGGANSRVLVELIVAAHRFGIQSDGVTSFHLTQKELSMSTGLSRETVSREIAALRQRKLIDIQKKVVTIKNLNLLEQELEQSVL